MFNVERDEKTLDELTAIWLRAESAERDAIRDAVSTIDQLMAADAPNQGESRAHGRRILIEKPLAITFRVYPNQRSAVVLKV